MSMLAIWISEKILCLDLRQCKKKLVGNVEVDDVGLSVQVIGHRLSPTQCFALSPLPTCHCLLPFQLFLRLRPLSLLPFPHFHISHGTVLDIITFTLVWLLFPIFTLSSGYTNCISHNQYILNEFLPLPLFVAMRPPLFLFPVPPFSLPRLMLNDKKPDKQRTDDGEIPEFVVKEKVKSTLDCRPNIGMNRQTKKSYHQKISKSQMTNNWGKKL